MTRALTVFAAGSLLSLASLGCVSQSDYDALRMDRDSLQAKLGQLEHASSSERDAMRSQLDQHNIQAQAARGEVEMCRAQLAQVERMQTEIRTKLEIAMPLLNFIVNSVQNAPMKATAQTTSAALPPRPAL